MSSTDVQERLYGSHPAGEGGEYETITLDSPLFSHRLKIVESEVVVTDPEPYPVAYLRVGKAVLEEKEGWTRPDVTQLRNLLGLDEPAGREGLDVQGEELLDDLGTVDRAGTIRGVEDLKRLNLDDTRVNDQVHFSRSGRWFAVSVDGRTSGDEDVGEELRDCFDRISSGKLSAEACNGS